MKIYRLFDPVEDQFISSGRSLYSKNGRSHWTHKSGALSTKRNLPDAERERALWIEYELVEVAREKIDWVKSKVSPGNEIETGDLHGDS